MKWRANNLCESKILTCIFLLVLVTPEYFNEVEWLDQLLDYAKLLIAILLLLASLISKSIHKSRIWIISFYGTMLFTTICGSGDIFGYMSANFDSLAVCLMFDIWLEKSPKTLLNEFRILEWLVYVNLVTILLFPNGLYRTDLYTSNWLLGYKNYQVRTILPIVCVAFIRSYWRYGRISLEVWLLLACSAATLVLVDSATALVGYALFIGMLALYHSKKKILPKIITLTNALIASVIAFICIVFFNMQSFLSYFIETVLGRNLSFTGRLTVWGMSISCFLERPILGYGYLSADSFVEMYNVGPWFTHPHNYMFYILLTGGLLLGIITVVGYYMASREINKNISSVYGKIILFTLCAFLVMGITESITSTVLLYPMLVLGMNIGKIASFGYPEQRKLGLKFGKKIVRI